MLLLNMSVGFANLWDYEISTDDGDLITIGVNAKTGLSWLTIYDSDIQEESTTQLRGMKTVEDFNKLVELITG